MAVSHIYGSMFHCFNMVKMSDVNNYDLKDTGIAPLNIEDDDNIVTPSPKCIQKYQ